MEEAHGTPLGYRRGCLCVECLLAWSTYIDHYRQARAAGMTFAEYLKAMGCTEINSWIKGQIIPRSQPAPKRAGTKPAPVNL
jgi:hypothetical protein